MEAKIMTVREFRSLGKRDFENGAVINEIASTLKLVETLKPKSELLDAFISDITEIADRDGCIHSAVVVRTTDLATAYRALP
jgi:hypothetical protein